MYKVTPKKRYSHTIEFLQSVLPAPATILDLGVRNELSEILETYGYTVFNTQGEDLDLEFDRVKEYDVDPVTCFQRPARPARKQTDHHGAPETLVRQSVQERNG